MLQRLRVRYPVLVGFLLIFVGLFVGEQYGIYHALPSFDKILHFAGGGVAAWFVLALMQYEIASLRRWKQVLIVVSVTALIGVVWEWAEYLSTQLRSSLPWLYRYFSGGNLADTLGDLVADTAGALMVALWALRNKRS